MIGTARRAVTTRKAGGMVRMRAIRFEGHVIRMGQREGCAAKRGADGAARRPYQWHHQFC
jgi:hypothetical protein